MLKLLKKRKYEKAPLFVQKKNYVSKMYQYLEFKIVDMNKEECIMVYKLRL